jgi:hypothetical protein
MSLLELLLRLHFLHYIEIILFRPVTLIILVFRHERAWILVLIDDRVFISSFRLSEPNWKVFTIIAHIYR